MIDTILNGRLHFCTQLQQEEQITLFGKSDLNRIVMFSVLLH